MGDALILAGTAIIGGMALNLHRRLVPARLIGAGMALLTLGWILTLAMSPSGPLPSTAGMAVGVGFLLTGVLLLAPAGARAWRNGGAARR